MVELADSVRSSLGTSKWLVVAFLCVALALNLKVVPLSHGQQDCNGTPTVLKWIDPSSAEAGDPVSVLITVSGCSGEVSVPIPFDGVLLIDMSNSMDDDFPQSDPTDLRLDAAISFVNCVAEDTELGVVAFSSTADLVQPMTNDKALLRSAIDGLRGHAEGGTNMYAGMELSQQHLLASSSGERERFIILLTDGADNSNHSQSEFVALCTSAAEENIHYLNIALGNEADLLTLIAIAELTEGRYYTSTTASELQGVYDLICAYAGSIAKTRAIVLNERLRSGLQVVPGTVVSDIPLSASQISQFEGSGQIACDFGTLGSSEGKFLRFDVTADCLTPDSAEESVDVDIDHPSSTVSYVFGVEEGVIPVPEKSYACTRPGDLRVEKEYDFQESKLHITLESRYLPGTEENIIRNIQVVERPSIWFQADPASASPPLRRLFPESLTDALLWEIPKLDPKEVKTLTVELQPMVCSENYFPPIDVNAQKITGGDPGEISYARPDGTAGRIQMPREIGSLTSVDTCDGRPDLVVAPPFTCSEFRMPPPISPFQVLYKHETPWIWVDCDTGNGFWDRTSENVGDFIRGAELSGSSSAPMARRIDVRGQGDYFQIPSNNRIFVKLVNAGDKPSDMLDPGLRLQVFNRATHHWEEVGAERNEVLEANQERLIVFELTQDQIRPEHIRGYALPPAEAMQIIRALDSGLANRIRSWAQNASEWNGVQNQGAIVPQDVLSVLPDETPVYDPFGWFTTSLHDRFQEFLENRGRHMAWGKPSVEVRVDVAVVPMEKHTNNNSSSEIIIVGDGN